MGRTEERAALEALCETVEATGGLVVWDGDEPPSWGPAADPSWSDLALAYMDACQALGRKPMKREWRGPGRSGK